MPVENRLADHRLWARPVVQHHSSLPLVRFQSPAERRRALTRRIGRALVILAAALLAAAIVAGGIQ